MLESLSIEALAHYTRGMATLFFVLLAIKFSTYRNRNKLAKILFFALCFMAFGFLKDVVFLFTPLMYDMFVMDVVSLIDNMCMPFVFAFFFEAARPGIVTTKRLLLAVALFALLIPIYIILADNTVVTVAYIASALVTLVSFVLIMIYVSRYDRFIENNYSYTQNITVRWVGGCAIAYFSWFIVYFLCFNETTWASEVFFDLFSIGIWYVLASFTHHHRIVVSAQELKESEGSISMEDDHKEEEQTKIDKDVFLSERLHQKMDVEKVYLDPNLSIVALAREIGSNKSYLSEYINRGGKTFYEYVNDYRISESCRLIEEKAAKGIRMPLAEVAQRSGFNSISSFNRHFYKIKSMTPSAYQRLQLMSIHEMTNHIRRNILMSLVLWTFACLAYAAPKSEAAKVRSIIDKVNNSWQTRHKPEATPFWHVAAYHTGNMEAYRLTGNKKYLDYSMAWAEHNKWRGATSNDRSKWKYNYGETPEHVLFGDWQICFQTYLDLYNILPDDNRIRRAREVMEYEMSTPANDYWWWADGLYMVMPVMTKLHKATGNALYLDKLYEYIQYSDSIMLDAETGLYFRDGKYVYPKHKSTNGKKDFWARGDGWVLAGLAKVLQDLPKDYAHLDFFVKKYQRMAKAVAECQQPEGYWTRSMLDPEHAPGPETSGTAFFTYGLQWGINNGYLAEAEYQSVINRAWKYLSEKALQKDGRVGYVQPIGERAIPGQVVDTNSEADFGVGAFLLAACERVRYLEAREVASQSADRKYWCELLYNMGMFDGKENYNEKGYLTIGFCGRQPNVADWYTNNGSLYMTSLAFLPLGLPATHPFWTDAPQPWTQVKAWGGEPFPKDHHWDDGQGTRDLF